MSPNDVDIDSLFDAVASGEITVEPGTAEVPAAAAAESVPASDGGGASDDPGNYDVFVRVGQLTRKLHDALRELGYDQNIETAVGALPDARARLSYIADLTGKAADRVLSAVDEGMAAEEQIGERANDIANKLGSMQVPSLRAEAHEFALAVQAHSEVSRQRLTEIMMAQDFHDLTGQMIKKIADLAHSIESQLVQLLLDTTPPDQRAKAKTEFLEGPVVDKSRTDVAHGQEDVDSLLDSLGF
ncbi:protein phosphatase CheZ [Derxia gummosa]|uniref:Protein phosphatase CheZ n=1 Tax=Derxia gummosa DSM 723 TaxID=1121388 RepID=A0A8B6XAR8_9BURK|nr:protein phosphatase CheZ [Derxia gummosa]